MQFLTDLLGKKVHGTCLNQDPTIQDVDIAASILNISTGINTGVQYVNLNIAKWLLGFVV